MGTQKNQWVFWMGLQKVKNAVAPGWSRQASSMVQLEGDPGNCDQRRSVGTGCPFPVLGGHPITRGSTRGREVKKSRSQTHNITNHEIGRGLGCPTSTTCPGQVSSNHPRLSHTNDCFVHLVVLLISNLDLSHSLKFLPKVLENFGE